MAVVGPRWPGPLEGSRAGWALWYLLHAPRQGRFPFCSPEVVERHQRRRLIATVSHVYRHVPYYRETMRRLGLTPGDFATAADLARLPLLERAEVQRDPELFVSDARPIEQFQSESTGGSLGEPLTVYKRSLRAGPERPPFTSERARFIVQCAEGGSVAGRF